VFAFFAGRRLSSLEDRIEKLENELRTANLDWDNLYQMCRKLLGRTVKERASIESSQEAKAGTPRLVAEGSNQARGPLTPRQVELQQQILRRRAGG